MVRERRGFTLLEMLIALGVNAAAQSARASGARFAHA